MKRLQRAAAWALCASLLVSNQGIQALAAQPSSPIIYKEAEEKEDSLPKATPSQADQKEEPERIEALLPLQPLEPEEWDGEAAIYWNPGKPVEWEDETATPSMARYEKSGKQPATPSDAAWATPSNAEWMPQGSDRADGRTPGQPVKSLKTAMNRAKKLAKELDVETEDVIIYAMNPMEIREGEAYFLNGKGMTVMAWDGRDYDSDLVFYVDGGQLSLEDVKIQPTGGAGSETSAAVVQADSGKVQLGKQVELSGAITLNYQETKETPEWLSEAEEEEEAETATASEAKRTGKAATASDAEEMGPDTDESLKPLQTENGAPVVELLKKFDGEFGPYYLDVQADDDLESVELVRSLYADDTTADEFMEQFYFSNMTDIRWEMEVYQESQGTVRKLKTAEEEREDAQAAAILSAEADGFEEETRRDNGREPLTKKRLVARASEGELIYWNPGPAVTVNGISYGAGSDTGGGGSDYPVKTWNRALEMVKNSSTGGTILAVQTLSLDGAGAAMEYIDGTAGSQGTEPYTYEFDGDSANGIRVRSVDGTAVFRVEEGVTAEFSGLAFTGGDSAGQDGAQAVETSGGEIVLAENVTTEDAYIQVNLEKEANDQEIPVQVCSEDVTVTLYFGGINDNLNKRFLDVVVPGGELAAQIDEGNSDSADAVGRILLENIALAEGNQGKGEGIYTWSLRQDGELDDQVANPQNLELYTDYYYEAVYLDGQRGNDDWLGASCQYPVKSFERAKALLTQEMAVSVNARKEAAKTREDPGEIALPMKIYICGTVNMEGEETWTLPEYTDYDGTPVKVEIVSHAENIAVNKDGNPVHELPASLVCVSGTGKLTLGDGIVIRNITDLADSATVDVLAGGSLTLTGDAVLTGAQKASVEAEEEPTAGFHVRADSAGEDGKKQTTTVTMAEDWTGAIELRGVGVYAVGNGTAVNMAGGAVQKNKSANNSIYAVDSYNSTLTDGFGAGIVCDSGAVLTMLGGKVSENISAYGGTGVLVGDNCKFIMKKGEISNNCTLDVHGASYGGGIYVNGKNAEFILGEENGKNSDCIIAENVLKADTTTSGVGQFGAGIAIMGETVRFSMYSGEVKNNTVSGIAEGGGIYALRTSVKIGGGKIEGNSAGTSSKARGGGLYIKEPVRPVEIKNLTVEKNVGTLGGGIACNTSHKVEMEKVIVSENEGSNGGGLYYSEYSSSTCGLYIKDSVFSKNKVSGEGGGITVSLEDCDAKIENTIIESNQSDSSGGGIYNYGGKGSLYGKELKIKNNKSKNGGGISGGGYYWNTEIVGNQADDNGGGVELSRENSFQLMETEDGKSSLKDNQAKLGGGLYLEKGSAYLALTQPVQNTASEQGNNIVLEGGTAYLLEGKFLHPEGSETEAVGTEPLYNVYLNRAEGDSGKFYIDPAKVSIENDAGDGEELNAIYLDSPDSYLTYLSSPGEAEGSLPITLNKDNFAVGSIVARPVGSMTITPEEFPEEEAGTRTVKVATRAIYSCDTASGTKADGSDYHEKSVTPLRTQLGGFTKDNLTNLVLVGQGIYLDGEHGNNGNNGLSPETAVKDFATAKLKLEAQVKTANEDTDGEGFSPFIYICGTVTVADSESWNLDSSKEPYSGSRYEIYEEQEGRIPEKAQVKRFASFVSSPMAAIEKNGSVTAETLIINGMKDSVITTEQRNLSPVFDIQGGALTLNGKAVVRDNYYNLIDMNGGKLVLDGTGAPKDFHQLEIRSHGYGVYADNDAKVEMKNGAVVYMENASGSSITSDKEYPDSSPDGYWQGVILDNGSSMTVKDSLIMQENKDGEGKQNGLGVVLGTWSHEEKETSLELSGNTKITGFYYAVRLKSQQAKVEMKGSSSLCGNGTGIMGTTKPNKDSMGNICIVMSGDSSIRDNVDEGIVLSEAYTANCVPEQEVRILMKERSKITSNKGGWANISLSLRWANETVIMCGNAELSDSIYGIQFKAGNVSPVKGSLLMKDNSVIKTHRREGIEIEDRKQIEITMEGHAKIYGNSDRGSSAGMGGISVKDSNCTIKMSDFSEISGNGDWNAISGRGYGIYFDGDAYDSSYPSEVTLEDHAVIKDNKEQGIFQVFNNYSDNSKVFVKLSGNSSVQGNGKSEIDLRKAVSELWLSDNAVVGESGKETDEDIIQLNCPLYLEGTATVNGMIYLQNPDTPIVMIKLVEKSGQEGKYQLHLAESFVGQEVVIPQSEDTRYPEEAETASVTSTADQLKYFTKAKGEGLAGDEERVLRATQTNIVLSGENNVYLSGEGDDKNNGLTPETAVRTFKRAKELLEGDGYFTGDETGGANIIITRQVDVLESDSEWNFNDGGVVKNSQSGNSWKPIIKVYEEFSGKSSTNSMIRVTEGRQLKLKNITIGDSDLSKKLPERVIRVDNGTLLFGEGSFLENIKGNSYGMIMARGENVNVIFDGGWIQNCSNSSSLIWVAEKAALTVKKGGMRKNLLTGGSVVSGVSDSSIKIFGGSLEENTITNSVNQSGIIGVDSSDLEISGGSIQDNQLTSCIFGAFLYLESSQVTISGGTIKDNYVNGISASSSSVYCKTGIFYRGIEDGNYLEISGGTISGNTTNANNSQATGKYSPIYIDGPGFKLKGGNATITDPIYLADTASPITLSGQIYQKDRVYTVYLNQTAGADGAFGPGSVVVQPDNNWLTDATPYLGNFNVISAPYILDQGQSEQAVGNGNTALKENQCLILMKAVFVDDKEGNDVNGGTSPADAVRTFGQAKSLGQTDNGKTNDHYVIYASGPVYASRGAESAPVTWTLPETAYLCRYTGFTVYDETGAPVSGTGQGGKGYTGELLVLEDGTNLALGDSSGSGGGTIRIYGRRGIDSDVYNGDSLVLVKKGSKLEIRDAMLARNNNTGTEGGQYEDALSGKGGAVRVEEDADLVVSGGSLSGLEAVSGAAVYVGGTLTLKNSPLIQGDVYLAERTPADGAGEAENGETFIQAESGYQPSGYRENDSETKLSVRVENDYNGRMVVKYPDEVAPTPKEMEYYLLEDYILSVYDFLQNPEDLSELTLQKRQAYFLDGTSGSDENDGSTPAKALKTVKGLYEKLQNSQDTAGATVYVVNGVTLEDDTVLTNYMYQTEEDGTVKRVYKGSYQNGGDQISVSTQVTFMRYIRPEGAETVPGFESAETCLGPLFAVTGNGDITFNGVYLDGGFNGAAYLIENGEGKETRLTAESCEDAKGPLISVSGENAKLTLAQVTDEQITAAGDSTAKAIRIRTTLRNNRNLRDKSQDEEKDEYVLGTLDGKTVYEGSSAGVEILSGAACQMNYTEFSNLSIGQAATGGTDVYDDGSLSIGANVHITGSVFLEGQGDEDDQTAQETSRYIEAEQMGNNWEEPFQLKLRDPYFGRTMVDYPDTIQDNASSSMVGYYILEEAVNDYFRLSIRESDDTVYELTPPPAVYIDGKAGSDTYAGDEAERMLGSSPKYPVKTLQKAYELMKNRAVNILYVVDTVEIRGTVNLTNTSYYDTSLTGAIALQNHLDEVEIRRYVKPTAAEKNENYNVDSFEDGPLLRIADGGTLTIAAEEGYGIDIDGHKEARTNPKESGIYQTEKGAEALAPLIEVEEGGTLNLEGEGVTLRDNRNVTGKETTKFLGLVKQTAEGTEGGAVNNGGTLRFAGAVLRNNEAGKGAGIYQDGTFTVSVSQPVGLAGQEIYLTTERTGAESGGTETTEEAWGEDHVIASEIWLEDSFKTEALSLNMDHAVKGRHVVVYNGYSGVDAQHGAYRLGETVPADLFLVESPTAGEDNILELQNWEMLDVTVPEEIFLAVKADKKTVEIADGASPEAELRSPEYGVTNNGPLAVKVSLTGFADTSAEAGIDQNSYGAMNLVDENGQATGKNDLYLAITGSGVSGGADKETSGAADGGSGENPFGGLEETSMSGYGTEGESVLPMGTLEPGETGRFKFTGTASESFISNYLDSQFPFEGVGDLSEIRKSHYRTKDEVTGEVTPENARARYRMTYRIELAEPRRGETGEEQD